MANNSIEVGKRHNLKVNNISNVGAYLDVGTGNSEDNILLPNNQTEGKNIQPGDLLDVLIYSDSEDRLIATLETSFAVVGGMAKLEVVDITNFGAFLDWGLPKDLLLPKEQQECGIKIGETYLVGLFEDKKGRVAATMNVYKFLKPNFELETNEIIKGTVYRIVSDMGIFVAIEDKYFGLISNNEFFNQFNVGDEIQARVVRVREDGKIDLSPRLPAHIQMDKDASMILTYMQKEGGSYLQITDKSPPQLIKREFGLSKNAFKRAIGGLFKNRLIAKTETGFKLTQAGKDLI